MQDIKVSIIIPTFNDEKYIIQTLNSILEQSVYNYEVIVIDDGSTDSTRKIVLDYIENNKLYNKVYYYFQENKDQLNAILNGLNYAKGEYIFILHSDDLICEKNSLEKCINYMDSHLDVDSIMGDLTLIDKNGNVFGIQHIKKYKKTKYILPLQLLWLGRNIYVDVGFHRKNSYITKNKENYLKWNTPFWIDFKNNIKMLNVNNVNFSFYKYRISAENYANDYNGQLNVINGELRTAINLMFFYNIPFYKFQYFLFRLLNKLKITYIPIYSQSEQKNKWKIIEFIIKKRFSNTYHSNAYLNALVNFYKNSNTRTIQLKSKIVSVYMGKDVRAFNKKLLNNSLEEIYYELFNEMNQGFNIIEVKNQEDKEKIKYICEFLCINPKIVVNL